MRAIVVLALLTSTAAAEPPEIHVEAGIGPRLTWGPSRYLAYFSNADDGEPHPAVTTTITTPFTRHLALGAHVAGARETYARDGNNCYRLYSFDLAAALAYRDPRFTLSSWLGRHVSRLGGCLLPDDDWTDDFTSFGAAATVSVVRELAVFVEAQSATGGATLGMGFGSRFNYTAVTLGVAYRR